MEDNTNSVNQPVQQAPFFAFDSPKGQSSYIKVIGVGGGGGNAVNHMYREGIKGVDFIVCNTDMKALNASPVPNKIPLGDLGLGAGNKPERASKAAVNKAADIKEALEHNTQMLFITAGMGGGTGTGAAPVIAEIAKNIDLENDENKKILVVAIVTRPFSFEGKKRRDQAEAGIEELRKHVDSIIVINNDKLRHFGDLDISQAFGMADDVLLTAAKGIAEIITGSGNVNIDFQDVNTVMEHSGTALMGAGSGKGENRAIDAITAASTSVLLDDSDIRGAKNVLLYFSYSSEHKIKMDEIGDITDFILDRTDGTADVIWGAGTDDSLDDELKVTLIATGFEKTEKATNEKNVIELAKDKPDATVNDVQDSISKVMESGEMTIIHREESDMKDEPKAFVEPVFTAESETPKGPINRIFLYDDEPVKPEVKQQPVVEEVDTLVEDIHMVSNDPQPEPAPFKPEFVYTKPDPVATVVEPEPAKPADEKLFRSAFDNMNDETLTKSRAERIRYIHEQLRNNPNGPDLVQSMSTSDIAGEELYEGRHSSTRESSSFSMRADGTMVKNAYFGDQPD
jgi:cell division protein FtsZ